MIERLQIEIRGTVQGVGFRPFVYRQAARLGLRGWVANSPHGVTIQAEGERSRLESFLRRLEREPPPRAAIAGMDYALLDPVGFAGFEIRESAGRGRPTASVLADIATCDDCRRELFDPANRRARYPFTNCTNCGPRYSIIEALPYDRARTVMCGFTMCAACRREYDDPSDRRFHAQPNACPDCGPQLQLWDEHGRTAAVRDQALVATAEAIRAGRIVAVKGLGGFHLMVDARQEAAVRRLRDRKHREEKPFALLFPSLESAQTECELSPLEARLLCSPEAPIVLLKGAAGGSIAPSVAPHNPHLGVMLPYTPLHHLLMAELGFPVVATSGNRSDEPICIDGREATARLRAIADLFLVHNRPIARPVDDSVTRVLLGREQLLRRARGYAPLTIHLDPPVPPMLAVGGQLKNTVAVAVAGSAVVSPHLGDLDTVEACKSFRHAISDLQSLYQLKPEQIVCDLHPDYRSTQDARASGLPVVAVQHHHAHVAACMADNRLRGTVLGVAWDGSGYGPDGTIWGGEFLLVDERGYRRVATFRRFQLPGGDRAVTEPRRAAVGLLAELWGEALWDRDDLAPLKAFTAAERVLLRRMIARSVNTPRTSSVGRLFDAVAALLELRQRAGFEGQAAMALEYAIDGERTEEAYPVRMRDGGMAVVDWGPMIEAVIAEHAQGRRISAIAAKFHNTLADVVVAVAERAGQERVVLTGGCFQNRYLTERTVRQLQRQGFHPYWHHRIPPNDGGIALGQLVVAAARSRRAPAGSHSDEEAGHVPGDSR